MLPLYTIPSYAPFVDTLAQTVLKWYGKDPLKLAEVTILLPTRRSCRALMDAFTRQTEGKPLLLPQIQPMGDMEEEEALFGLELVGKAIALPEVISSTEQRLLLTQLVEAWQQSSSDKKDKPKSLSHAAQLAVELASFLAEIQRQQVSLDTLESLVPEALASHWQLTLQFLRILIDTWPQVLAAKNKVDPGTYRNLILAAQCAYWKEEASDKPVIAAGSTGSLPSVAHMLETIAGLPNGRVILPGLDQHMEEAAWEILEPSHPQYGLKQLLQRFNCHRMHVQVLGEGSEIQKERAQFASWMMLPASYTDKWQQISSIESGVIEGLRLLTTAHLQEEAEVIALHLRQVLETPGKTAALITHERALARKTATILRRWGIEIDDSAGIVLNATPPAVFLRLLMHAMESGGSIHALLSLLKHPLAAGGMNPVVFRHVMYSLEKNGLRGVSIQDGLEGLLKQAAKLKQEEGERVLHHVVNILRPFISLRKAGHVPLHKLLQAHLEAACALATTDTQSGKARLLGTEEGKQLGVLLQEFEEASRVFPLISPSDYRGIFDALLAGKVYRPPYGKHPRLAILSPIEARMLPFDFIILGGLNEGVWPALPEVDPWMSRTMRHQFGLPQPERQIGLSAHDFVQLIGHSDVLITRSQRVKGAQTIPSRWVLTLEVLCQRFGLLQHLYASSDWQRWLRRFHHTAYVGTVLPPAPTPPIHVRPLRLSVTDIERWMRNPYGLYAKKILDLHSLKPLEDMPSVAEFGNSIHAVLDSYIKACDAEQALEDSYDAHLHMLLELGRKKLQEYMLHPVTYTFWWTRFESIAAWFVKQERHKRAGGVRIASEQTGEIAIEGGFTLSAKADRIEVHTNGVTVIDYKTGTVPSQKDIALGFSPQMVLEGMIAMQGGFEACGRPLSEAALALQYWKMSGGSQPVKGTIIGQADPKKEQTVDHLIKQASKGLTALVAAFNNPLTPYLAVPNPDKAPTYDDYAHLARVKEWEGG